MREFVVTDEFLERPFDMLKVENIFGQKVQPLYMLGFKTHHKFRNLIEFFLNDLNLRNTKIFGIPVHAFGSTKHEAENAIASFIATDGSKNTSTRTKHRVFQSMEKHQNAMFGIKFLADLNNIPTLRLQVREIPPSEFRNRCMKLITLEFFDNSNFSDRIYIPKKRRKENDPPFVNAEFFTHIQSISVSDHEYDVVSFDCELSGIRRFDGANF